MGELQWYKVALEFHTNNLMLQLSTLTKLVEQLFKVQLLATYTEMLVESFKVQLSTDTEAIQVPELFKVQLSTDTEAIQVPELFKVQLSTVDPTQVVKSFKVQLSYQAEQELPAVKSE